MAKKLSDFDKNLKPRHLGDKQVTLTISHVGIKQKPKQEQERVITLAGEMPEEKNYDEQLVLYFTELGSSKLFAVNNTNREVLINAVGDDPKNLLGRRVVLQVQEKAFFGRKRPMVTITNVLARDNKKAPTESGVVDTDTGEIVAPASDAPTPQPLPNLTTVTGPGVQVPSHAALSPVQRKKLVELYRVLHKVNEPDAYDGLNAMFEKAYGHDMSKAGYEEGARLTGQLLSALREKQEA